METPAAPRWLRRGLPVAVLIVGIGVTLVLVRSRQAPKRAPEARPGMLVEVITARAEDRQVEVTSQGTVQPLREVSVSSQVPGRVIWVHPQLLVGGMAREGASLIKLDPVDFKLALERAQVAQVQAEKTLAETESNAMVARREWKVLGEQAGREANPLALFEPQLKLSRASLRSAHAEVEQARVNLSRTVIRAPFNLRVRRETVGIGQYVAIGQSLATVYGIDQAEVIVPLPVAELRWIELPAPPLRRAEPTGAPSSSRVTVSKNVGGQRYAREGVLVRTVGEVDAEGRMSRVVVRIDDPYNLQRAPDATGYVPDFEVGTFVDVTVHGQTLRNVIPIPAEALRLGSVVWTASADDRLQIREVQVGRETADEVYVSAGLRAGERIVLTPISGAVAGMRLRVKKPASTEPASSAPRALQAEAR